jgi:hypothetical protein
MERIAGNEKVPQITLQDFFAVLNLGKNLFDVVMEGYQKI